MRFARFGTMFFANPVVGACVTCARRLLTRRAPEHRRLAAQASDNEWLHRAETIVAQFLDRPEEYDEPTCGPGPFSMANPETR